LSPAVDRRTESNHASTAAGVGSRVHHRPERLKGDRAGQYSVRINDQYRVCFAWKNGDAYDVEITDYH